MHTNNTALPPHRCLAMPLQGLDIVGLGEHVRPLVERVHLLDVDRTVGHMGPEVVVFHVDVFRPWAHCWRLGRNTST